MMLIHSIQALMEFVLTHFHLTMTTITIIQLMKCTLRLLILNMLFRSRMVFFAFRAPQVTQINCALSVLIPLISAILTVNVVVYQFVILMVFFLIIVILNQCKAFKYAKHATLATQCSVVVVVM